MRNEDKKICKLEEKKTKREKGKQKRKENSKEIRNSGSMFKARNSKCVQELWVFQGLLKDNIL